jgi:putative DNA primase/helicase
MKTVERARGRWREILPQFGIETRFLKNSPGPCPLCGGKDRYRFDDKDGAGWHYCNQCGPGPGLMLIRKKHGWDHATACAEVDKIIGRGPPQQNGPAATTDDGKEKARRLARLKRALAEADDPRVVDAFLRQRGLTVVSSVLRGHRAHPYYDDERRLFGRFPAVLAPILSPEGVIICVTALYCALAPEPRKKNMPRVETINGGAVRLHEPENGRLGVAEGIATALAARQLFGVPTWAALSATGLKTFVPPPGIERITIFADNDKNHVGPAAAYDLAQRLERSGIAAEVRMPTVSGHDFADLLPQPKELT